MRLGGTETEYKDSILAEYPRERSQSEMEMQTEMSMGQHGHRSRGPYNISSSDY